jgi:hypothetical protein
MVNAAVEKPPDFAPFACERRGKTLTWKSRLGQRKAKNIVATGAQAVFSGNVGCTLQIIRHLREMKPDMWVAHPVDALWASYSGEAPKEIRGTA